jgi:predicted aspartyl protease
MIIMGKISAQVKVTNYMDPKQSITFSGLVDTGAGYLVLPTAWMDRLGKLDKIRNADVILADQSVKTAEIYGPVKIKLEGFEPILGEVMFVDMIEEDGDYTPLIGYLVLETCNVAVDMMGHRLINAKRIDLR